MAEKIELLRVEATKLVNDGRPVWLEVRLLPASEEVSFVVARLEGIHSYIVTDMTIVRNVRISELIYKILQTGAGRSLIGLSGGEKEVKISLLDSLGKGLEITIGRVVDIVAYYEWNKEVKPLYRWQIPLSLLVHKLLLREETQKFLSRLEKLRTEMMLAMLNELNALLEYVAQISKIKEECGKRD